MKICLIGNSLSNLVLAKNLLSRKIKIDLFYEISKRNNNNSRTLGITQDNIDYFKNNIFDLKNMSWQINKINIFNESNTKNEILKFGSEQTKLFSIVKYNDLLKKLNGLLKKEKNLKTYRIKKNLSFSEFVTKKYNIIINSEKNNKIIKNNFSTLINKDYNSTAYTTIIDHNRCKNKTATQIFTKLGPIAFLPISNYQTSIVFSLLDKKENFDNINIKKLINKYNYNYKIKSFSKFEIFKLKYFFPRNYYFKNILLFGDSLHQIHPLAGQGFNMTLRDIKFFLELVDEYMDLGLNMDKGIFMKFEDKVKHSNFILSHGIDFIYEFFKFDNKFNNKISNKLFKLFNKNKLFNKYIEDFANRGINF